LEEWDYAPFGGEMCGASLVPFSDNAKTFVEPGPGRIGRKYLKARYVEFTDKTFTERKRRAPEWEHLGVMGPALRAAVGDTLKVTFKNMLPKDGGASVSMHPHGVLYDKSSEGSPYADGAPSAFVLCLVCLCLCCLCTTHKTRHTEERPKPPGSFLFTLSHTNNNNATTN
jgi:hephaestin